jgi:signal recognition particle subunit SRP54
MAQRILGMGDILTLVEQAQNKFDQDEMAKQEERLRKGEFSLEDFRNMMSQTKKLGPLNKIMSLLPGMGNMQQMMDSVDAEGGMKRLGGIVDAMTPNERRNPSKLIDQSRRRRIAAGAGVEPHEVNELVKQFDGMAAMMKEMAGLGMRDRFKKMQELQSGLSNPMATLQRPKVGTGKRLNSDERAKLRKQREKDARRRKRETKKGS